MGVATTPRHRRSRELCCHATTCACMQASEDLSGDARQKAMNMMATSSDSDDDSWSVPAARSPGASTGSIDGSMSAVAGVSG